MRPFLTTLLIAAACALAPLAPALAQTGPPAAPQGVKPRTMAEHRAEARARSEAARAEQRRIEAEENAGAQQASDEANQRWEEMRARNAAQIRQFDEAVEDWAEDNRPPGTAEDFVATSYDEDTALADSARVTFYNGQNVPTHRVTFGPDAKPTGPLTLTQQGKAWETIGPQLVDGATWAATYGRDVHGDETITAAEIVKDGKVIGFYQFNAEGLPWRGERWGPDGKRSGGFYDPRFEPQPRTVGSALDVPATPRLITGVCFACRDKADRYNDLANQASQILAQMREQSAQNQQAFPEAQLAIKQRYDKLAADLAALMPQLEAAKADALACEKTCQPQAEPQPDAIAAGPPSAGTPKLPAPDLTRPGLLPVGALQPPASFCDEFARVAYMNEFYTPAAKASLANARTATEHLGKLGGMFTDYMKNEGGPGWAAVRDEQTAYGPIAGDATAQSNAINAMYQQVLAIPIVPCPDQQSRIATGGDSLPAPAAPVSDGVGVIPARGPDGKRPCPPKQGRKPITVGSNAKVGSGAQLTKKLGGMLVGGLLGAAGVGGGGGGGGPQMYKCRIKDSEMTVFTHPSGLALRVGAKRGKGDVVNVFADIARSPDKGTFQTAFLEKPDGGQVQAPFDVGPCDLWGDWELTVSWTKTTYVNGQMVSQESGGWSETGKFSIPGTLSKESAPTGLWKQMGFSSASHGARQAFMAFRVPQGGGPTTFVVHITQPRGDPVTTVPFVMTMVETAPGVFNFTQLKTEEDCPPVPADRVMISDGGAPSGPRLPASPPATPAAPSSAAIIKPRTGFESADLTGVEEFIDNERAWALQQLDKLKTANACDGSLFDDALEGMEEGISKLRLITGEGPMADAIREAVKAELPLAEARYDEALELRKRRCPASPPPAQPAEGESILDEIDDTNPEHRPLDPLPADGGPKVAAPTPGPTAPVPQGPGMSTTSTPAGQRLAPGGGPVQQPTPATPTAEPAKPAKFEIPVEDLGDLEILIDKERSWANETLEKLRSTSVCDEMLFEQAFDGLSEWYSKLRFIKPSGPLADGIREAVAAEMPQVQARYDEVHDLWTKRCKKPGQPPAEGDPEESILDEIDEVFVPA